MSWTDDIRTIDPITHSSPAICTSDVSWLETLEFAHVFGMDYRNVDKKQADIIMNWAKKRTTKDADWGEVIKQERNKLGDKNAVNDLFIHVMVSEAFENIKNSYKEE